MVFAKDVGQDDDVTKLGDGRFCFFEDVVVVVASKARGCEEHLGFCNTTSQ